MGQPWVDVAVPRGLEVLASNPGHCGPRVGALMALHLSV